MKVIEILSENKKLDEAPVGGLAQGLKKLGAKALSAVGASSAAMNLAGQVDVGQKANDLFNAFNSYLGTQGQRLGAVTADDVSAFLKSQGLTSSVHGNTIMNKTEINQEFMKAARSSYAIPKASVPPTPQTSPVNAANLTSVNQINAAIQKLTPDQQKQLMQTLQKTTDPAANRQKKLATAAAAANKSAVPFSPVSSAPVTSAEKQAAAREKVQSQITTKRKPPATPNLRVVGGNRPIST